MDRITNHEYGLQRILEVTTRLEGVKFQPDFDAIPRGEERFRTVHFGWVDFGDEASLISISTNADADVWEMSVRGFHRSAFVEFRNGNLLGCEDDGDVCMVGVEGDVPSAVVALLDASREAGMSDFHFSSAGVCAEAAYA